MNEAVSNLSVDQAYELSDGDIADLCGMVADLAG